MPCHGYAGHSASELRSCNDVASFRQGDGEPSIEGIACARGFNNWTGVYSGDELCESGIFRKSVLGAECHDDVARTAF